MSYFDTVNPDDYRYSVDWINGVLQVGSVVSFFDELKKIDSRLSFDRWEQWSSGLYNYRLRYCLNGSPSFSVAYNPDFDKSTICPENYASEGGNNPGIFVSISGDGLRFLNSVPGTLQKLFGYFASNGFKCSRFDVALDILDPECPVVPLIQTAFRYALLFSEDKPTIKTCLHRTRSNFKVWEVQDDNGDFFYNIQMGTHGTRSGMFRCYNKYDEIQSGRLKEYSEDMLKEYAPDGYWWRMEYEIHKAKAAACFDALMSNPDFDLSDIFFAAADMMFDVIVPYAAHSAVNLAKCPLDDVWSEFLDFVSSHSEYLV